MAEKSIELDSVEIAAAIFGNCDRNIRLLEKEFSVTAVCRGTMLRLSGEEANVAAAVRAVEGMLLLIENHTPLEDQTVRYCLSLAHDGKEQRVRELTDDFVTVTVKGRPIRPKTLGQKEYLNAIRKNAVTFGVGSAGTGKTYLAVAMAVKAFKAKDVSRIVLTRPAVEAGEKLGFLPGDLQQKVDPYLRPLYDGLFDMLGAETYERLVEKQIIEVAPLAYMRGRTLDDSFIILDEAQNTTPEQMKMFLTRMGVGSKVVVTGDVTQIDLPDGKPSGLREAMRVLKKVEGIGICELTNADVVRHVMVQRIVKAYEEYETAKNGGKGYIAAKINSLCDMVIMDKLVEASQAGVKVDLVVRGICCLIAGVEGYTENITVRSIVGRFLEHSRIFIFGRDGKEQKIYIGSADYMPRNTIRRVEVAAPVEDERLKKRIREIFRTLMSDNTKARVMQSDGTYVRLTPAEGEEPVCAQEVLYDDAYKRIAEKEVKQERMRKNREKGKAKASAKKKTTAKDASSAGKGKTRGRS